MPLCRVAGCRSYARGRKRIREVGEGGADGTVAVTVTVAVAVTVTVMRQTVLLLRLH